MRTKILPIQGIQGINGSPSVPGNQVELTMFIWSQKDNVVSFSGKFRCYFLPTEDGYFVGQVEVRILAPVMPNFTTEYQACGVTTSDPGGYDGMSGGIRSSVGPGYQDLIIYFSKIESSMDFADINFTGHYEIQPVIE